MKNIIKMTLALSFAVLLSMGTMAEAKNTNLGGGFTGTMPTVITVKDALKQKDDTFVGLQGKIVRALGDEDYIFSDGTGEIEIEIDDKVWKGLTADENTVITVYGTIDKDVMKKAKLDVDQVVVQ